MAKLTPNKPDAATLSQMLAELGSATAIANKLGVHKSSVCNWLRENGTPTPRVAPAIERFDSETLCRMLVELGSASAVAKSIGVHITTACKWYRDNGAPAPRQNKFVDATIHCPFTPAELHRMYWNEYLSMRQIAAKAAVVLHRDSVSPGVAMRWLREAGIKSKPAEVAVQMIKLKPETADILRASGRKLQATRPSRPPQRNPPPPSAEARAKGRPTIAARRLAEAWETRVCARDGCERTTTRIRSSLTRPPERTFCSRRCSALAMSAQRSLSLRATLRSKSLAEMVSESSAIVSSGQEC